MTEKVLIEMEVQECARCPFLNCSDVGEDCNILRVGIHENEWSNIGYQFGDNWRYKNCPLLHPYGYLKRNAGIKVLK